MRIRGVGALSGRDLKHVLSEETHCIAARARDGVSKDEVEQMTAEKLISNTRMALILDDPAWAVRPPFVP